MDKYELPAYVLSRVRYYDGEYLKDDEFIDEQKYHVDRRQRHDRLLHVAGVCEGLVATLGSPATSLKVSPGTAVDDLGQQILVHEELPFPVPAGTTGALYLEILFKEKEDRLADANAVGSSTRFAQAPELRLSAAPSLHSVVLGRASITNGTVSAIAATGRLYSGLRLPGPGGAAYSIRALDAPAGTVELGATLSVTGSLAVGTGDAAGNRLRVSGNTLVEGALSFGAQTRQMVNLLNTDHALGVQASTVYLRTSKNFAVYRAGVHSDAELAAGVNGTVDFAITSGNVGIGTADPQGNKLRVTGNTLVDGSLTFSPAGGQMVNLSSASYGIGLQPSTLYLRTPRHFAVYQGGSHVGSELAAGVGGKSVLHIADGVVTVPANLTVNGVLAVNPSTSVQTYLTPGALVIGNANASFGGGTNLWNPNTAGLLMETQRNTEIAVHDAGNRVVSLMYYEGDADNRLTIGRDMGWGALSSLVVNGALTLRSTLTLPANASISAPGRMHITGDETLYLLNRNGVIVSRSWGGNGNFSVEGSKNFLIDHPLDPRNKQLVHSTIEGPECGVYYRGEARLEEGRAAIKLPDYFEALVRAGSRSVTLTPLFEGAEPISMLAASEVSSGRFEVRAIDERNPSQRFYWEVKAVRADVPVLEVERLKPPNHITSERPLQA